MVICPATVLLRKYWVPVESPAKVEEGVNPQVKILQVVELLLEVQIPITLELASLFACAFTKVDPDNLTNAPTNTEESQEAFSIVLSPTAVPPPL